MIVKNNQTFHLPVLTHEVISALQVEPGGWYIDATIGGGRHTEKIVEQGGYVLGIDQDKAAISDTDERLKKYIVSGQLILRLGNFSKVSQFVQELRGKSIKGILFDLGMSTYQIKESGRGFSFLRNEPLDMRMSGTGLTATEIINSFSRDDLYEIFRKYGEENLAWPLAHAICRARAIGTITKTSELVQIVVDVYERAGIDEKIHPGTRMFQALRIAVNQELNHLKEALPQAVSILAPFGRCLVISFHSLEDRIVKQFFLLKQTEGIGKITTKKPIIATEDETRTNPASRSAKLRVFEKN